MVKYQLLGLLRFPPKVQNIYASVHEAVFERFTGKFLTSNKWLFYEYPLLRHWRNMDETISMSIKRPGEGSQ